MEETAIDKENSNIKKARLWFCLSGAFFVIVFVWAGYLFLAQKTQNTKAVNAQKIALETKNNTVTPRLSERMLDGTLVYESQASSSVYGVMIDNHVDARPEAGLEKAGIVFEAEAEGGITRFLAFFSSDMAIEKIGPVRSARPYFVDWANEFNALYAHVGGSPDALAKLIDEDFFAINEFFNGAYFWRDTARLAPHNVYTSSRLLNSYINKHQKNTEAFLPWKYKADADLAVRPDATNIKIEFAMSDYIVSWKYDKNNNDFIRFIADEPQKTESNDFITARNVAIMYVAAEAIDDKLRLDLKNIGTGEALACFDGKCQSGTWSKPAKEERTRFFIGDNEVMFNRGTTWVEVVKQGYKVTY